MIIPSLSCVLQTHDKHEVVKYDQPPIFKEEGQLMTMDKGTKTSLYLQHKNQLEANNNANAALLPLQNLVKYDTDAYVASQDVEVIVYQNLCEKESHIAKLKQSETKSELCDSTHSEHKSTNNENVRDTLHSNRKFECQSCDNIFETNPFISTASILFPSVQICSKNEEAMTIHDVTILVERDEKVAKQLIQLYAAHNMIHDEASGEILETSSMILALIQLIQGTENNLDLCNTLKFSNFRMLIGKIIKQRFSHNFKNLPKIYLLYTKFRMRKSIDCFYKLNKINVCVLELFWLDLFCYVLKKRKKTKQPYLSNLSRGPSSLPAAHQFCPAQLNPPAHSSSSLPPIFFFFLL
jgi:hypothetical protein